MTNFLRPLKDKKNCLIDVNIIYNNILEGKYSLNIILSSKHIFYLF